MLSIINDAVCALQGDIPLAEWKEPYQSAEELDKEQADGVQFYGLTKRRHVMGVAGIQHVVCHATPSKRQFRAVQAAHLRARMITLA